MRTVSDVIRALEDREIQVVLEKKLTIPREFPDCYKNMQGCGSDGRYGYFVLVSRGDSATAKSHIYKVDLETWKIVKISGELMMNHANDVAYDSKNHRLIVSHCDVNPDEVSVVDPDTLEILETKKIPQRHFSIAYNPNKGLYVAGKSRTYDFVLLDDDFRPVRLLPGVEGYVKQGLECDDEFIYFFQTGKEANWIFVFDWEGSLIRKIVVPMVGESESLFVRGDRFVAAFNNHADRVVEIYELFFSEKA